MKKQVVIIFLLGVFGFSFTFAKTELLKGTQDSKGYQVLKVTIDGNSKIVVSVADNQTPAKSLKTLMESVGGTHAINGGFFCPAEKTYSRCEGNTTDGLRISNGIFFSKRGKDIGENKTVLGFDVNSNPMDLVNRDDRTWANGGRANKGFDEMQNGMMMGTLVKDGVNVAVNNTEMNNDPKQGKAGNKTFICYTQDKKTVYMGYVDGVTFSSLADYILKNFGCYNAIQLDNGGSKAMINNKQYVAGPGRNIMDAFVIVESKTETTPVTGGVISVNSDPLYKIVDGLVLNLINKMNAKYTTDADKIKYLTNLIATVDLMTTKLKATYKPVFQYLGQQLENHLNSLK